MSGKVQKSLETSSRNVWKSLEMSKNIQKCVQKCWESLEISLQKCTEMSRKVQKCHSGNVSRNVQICMESYLYRFIQKCIDVQIQKSPKPPQYTAGPKRTLIFSSQNWFCLAINSDHVWSLQHSRVAQQGYESYQEKLRILQCSRNNRNPLSTRQVLVAP